MNGTARIAEAFQRARSQGRAALMPYLTLGYPTPGLAVALVEAAGRSGADLMELGLPFSDPLADGPTIQHSTQVALQQGMTAAGCLEQVAQARARGVSQPFFLMGYVNPLLAYGLSRFAGDVARVGADGLIIPDLPPEEAGDLENACRQNGLALVYLAPPNSAPERLRLLAERTSGFLYLVSVKGVTGARTGLPPALEDFVGRARQSAHTPVAVGFGIATPDQAAAVGRMADGVIVGSALINTIDANPRDPVQAAGQYIASLAKALESG